MTVNAPRIASRLVCSGCGREAPPIPDGAGLPFRCAAARDGDDIDHVVTRTLDAASVAWPRDRDPNPFVAYRTLLHSWHVARAFGMSDADYVALVRGLDEEIGRIDGHGFRVTPFRRERRLAEALGLGGVWVKDETGNVSGSHKARHLAGIMLYLKVLESAGLLDSRPPLAIASCGNAALAAGVVARAARHALDVFIPPDAPPAIVGRLTELNARTIVCRRTADAIGDPCYLRFRDAVAGGALPFCCQGPANGLTIEGGETIGWEMMSAIGTASLDAIVIQVGGGALASAIAQAFAEAHAIGACERLPRFYTVQTEGAAPLKRAYDRVASHVVERSDTRRALAYAATHRSEFMWPWESEPRSLARGILDDETYDWLAVVKGMLETGGRPIVVDERQLAAAYDLARAATGIPVDHTGASGLAGLTALARGGDIGPAEHVAIVFSGRERVSA